MELKRRTFLKWGGVGLAAAGLDPRILFSSPDRLFPEELSGTLLSEQLLNEEFPFPYDPFYFSCAERIYSVRRREGGLPGWKARLNLILKEGKRLDIKILVSEKLEDLSRTSNIKDFSGVEGILDVEVTGYDSRRLYYQVLYREGNAIWKALSPKSFKLPNVNLEKGEDIKVLFISDDHTFDDADYEVPDSYKLLKLNGDCVNEILKKMRANPSWVPEKPLGALKNSVCLASALRYIMAYEDPDFLINLGDTNGIGASYKWEKLGLPARNLSENDYEYISKTLWLRMRKMYSAITPSIPMYIAMGNHDGEEQWNLAKFSACDWRKKIFALPDQGTYPEGGHPEGKYYAFSWGSDPSNRGGVQFIILHTTAFCGNAYPVAPEQWTLGAEQFQWFEQVLKKSEKDWVFACFHHVLGGWPAGPDETRKDIAYGRGPLFTAKDYTDYCHPSKVEQVMLTELAKENGLRAFIYGHDHIFHTQQIGNGLNQKDMLGVCVGSTKYMGEVGWWDGAYWKKHYGLAAKTPPDFWGPSGITKLTVKADEAKIDYLVTGSTAYSNLPSAARPGYVLSSTILVNPPPLLAADKPSLSFQAAEGRAIPASRVLLIKNGGARDLHYQLSTDRAWISVSPEAGSSWGEWDEHTVGVDTAELEEGTYEGKIFLKSTDASNSPLTIKVNLKIDPPPIYAPLNFKALRLGNRTLFSRQGAILLTWEDHPLNRRIMSYRMYLVDERGKESILTEFRVGTKSYVFKDVSPQTSYRFALSAVDVKGREGEKASAAVR